MASLTVSSFGPYYQISHATFAANPGDSIVIINGPGGGATYEAAIVLDENLTINAFADVGLIQLNMATGIVRLNARGDSSFFITGNASGNIISGGNKDDLFLGEGGNDTLNGGGGDDTAAYLFAPAGVSINIANGGGSNGYGGTDTFTSIESLIGSQHSDTLIGDSADNYFFGLQGNDIITGAGGVDTVSYEDIGLGGGAVVVNLATGTASDGFGGTDTLSGIERVVGTDFSDSLTGDANDNSFLPGVGNDTVNGGGGTDFVSYETSQSGVTVNLPGQTAIDGLGGTDTLIGIEGVLGSIFGDSITGGSEANIFSGSAGSDTLFGGGGFDITRYNNSTSGVTVNLATGTASDGLGGTDTLFSIEGVEGSAFADTLTGTSGDNLFWGMNGDDTIIGGDGNDTASYALAASNYTVTYIPGDGTYTVAANTGDEGTDTLTSIEFLQFGFGTAAVDINSVVVNPPSPNGTYVGDANDNTFDPGDGNDTIDGQGGLDTVTYASSTGAINVNLATGVVDDGMGGTDTLTSIERVFGSDFGDTLTGSDGNDAFLPGLGDDTIMGGLGTDSLQFFAATVVDVRNGTATGGEGTDTFSGIEIFYGSSEDDTFHDADGAFLYDGNGGSDLVSYTQSTGPIVANMVTGLVSDGSGAVDTLVAVERIAGSANSSDFFVAATTTTEIDGDAGLDTVSFSEFGSGVTVARNGNDLQATAAGGVRVDLKSIEIFEGSQHNDTLVGLGNSLDVLIGLGGDDRLENLQVGAAGVLASYRIDPSAVIVNLSTGMATDGFGGTDTLVNIDNVEGSAHHDTFTGNASANLFVGHAGNDTIDGGGGTDVAVYALAADQYTVTHNAITGAYTVTALSGTEGVDTLTNVERIAFENGNTEVAIGDVAVAIPTVTLTGDGTDNLFTPGAGDNNIIDGLGGFDTVTYATAPSGVTVNLQTGIASDGQGGSDSLTSIERIIGSAFADTITGSGADETFEMTRSGNVIDGGAGIDTLSYINDATGITVNGTPGVVSQQNVSDPPKDTFSNIENFVGTRHYDLFYDTEGSHGYDGVDGQRDDLVLDRQIAVHIDLGLGQIIEETGGVNTFANIKRIIAASNDDRVVWAPSDTTVAAGGGDDTLSFAKSATGIEFDFGATAGYHGVDGSGKTFNAYGFEIVEGSAHDDVFQGSEWQTNIELLGLAGDDILRGASANSAAVVWVSYRLDPTGVSVNLDLGIASDGFGGADTLQHIDGVEGSQFADVLVGDGNGTLFRGLGGDDVFHGSGHASDTVVYKLAQNQYSIHYEAPINAFVVTALSGDEGTDVLRGITTLSFNDGANDVAIETAAGGGALALTIITGSAGDDYFALTSAIEAVYGMDGIDVVSYRSSPGAVTVNLATDTGLDGNGGSDVLWSIEGVAGSAFNDTLTGSGEDEIFFGSGGLDTMDAAGGSDTLSYVGYSEGVIVNRVSGRVETGANPLTTKDTITGFESYAGTAFDDVFYDRPGTISVDGLGGLDQFSAEHISEGGHFELGVGRVRYDSGREVSLSNIESIVGTQFDDTVTGTVGDNGFTGRAGNDVLDGAGGTDTAVYALAQDQYTVTYDSGSNSYTVTALSGDEGTDTLTNIEILSFSGGTVGVAIADALPAPLDTTSDFDGDGDDDIVFSLTASGNSVFNNADGTGGGWIGYADRTVIGTGDFNGDGDADLLFRFADGNHSGFDSGGGGPWLGRLDRTAMAVGDFNGDGDDDVLFQFANGNKHIADADSGNTWVGFADRSVEGVGDFDGDGDDDVLFELNAGGYVTNNVDGTGGRWLGGPNRDVAGIGDFDGDGDDDILFVLNSGGHIINDGEGGGMQWFGFTDRSVAGIGDFDGDGNDDILFRLADGNHTIISPNGVGRWIARTNNTVRDVGDYDGDGDDDILFEAPGGGFVVDQADGGVGLGMYFLDRTLVAGDPLGIGLTSDADLV
ncbi:calcium-binding protein [Pyruvatibacter sp.]|uniref:beta strand repeat-containing protein n=1 Tax=Pyruvatibacter sp. TaxID=1981328 RepID=UPI003264D13F